MAARGEPEPSPWKFGPFRYDPAERALYRGSEPVPLVPKVADLLHALLERRGRVVEKAELMRLVWPDATVEETGLARNISLLRKALGEEGEAGGFIETIPKRGYRFRAAEPEAAPAPARRRRWPWAMAAAALLAGFVWWQFYLPSRYLPRGSRMAQIAALPFEALTPGALPESFPEALNELIVAGLMQRGGTRVISPATVRRYQRFGAPTAFMARVLGLDVVLEGTLQQAGGRFRVTARLADVHSGKLIWADAYEYPADEAESALGDAARRIAAAVSGRLVLANPE